MLFFLGVMGLVFLVRGLSIFFRGYEHLCTQEITPTGERAGTILGQLSSS
ncbi:MAG: hypothetical protein JJP05_02135 [cyanobacterium endosymbiont of Rhopalodia gibba]